MATTLEQSKTRELLLWKDYRKGDLSARTELLRSLNPLIQRSVNKYTNSGLPREALETEARTLAARAFESYNPQKAALGTHVTNHLKHLQRFVIEYQNVAKIPENRAIAISKFQNIKTNLTETLAREPTTIELAEELNWSPAEVNRMLVEQRRDLSMISGEDILYENILKGQDITLEAIYFVYYTVGNEEKKILEWTFSLFGHPRLSVSEIAFRLNKSETYIHKKYRELIEQINNARGYI